jgi:hypothetical protein
MRFVVEPRLLDHSGVAMHNTLEQAIAELVANGYDADADEVKITLDDDAIVVADNGRGMTPDEVQNNYLRLGRDRRASDKRERTAKRRRAIIGHKGIGKLAGLGIAETMIVTTRRAGKQTKLTIDRSSLDVAESLERFDLKAVVKSVANSARGTEVRLQGLLIELDDEDAENLRENLAFEMPSAKNWRILVNDVEASAEDIAGQRYPINDQIKGFGRVTGFYKIVQRRKDMPAGFAVRGPGCPRPS